MALKITDFTKRLKIVSDIVRDFLCDKKQNLGYNSIQK